MARENLRKPEIVKEIKQLGDYWSNKDITDLIDKLSEGKKEVLGKSGEIVEVRDNTSINEAVDKICKIKGLYAPDKQIKLNIYKDWTEKDIEDALDGIKSRLAPTSPAEQR